MPRPVPRLLVLLALVSACAPPAQQMAAPPLTTAPGPQLGALVLGIWDIFPAGVASPHLTLIIETAEGPDFSGRLTRAFSGNVGLDPEPFQPFTGTVSEDSVAKLSITVAAQGAPPVEIEGKVTGAEWRITHFIWGGDQQVREGVTWTGKRVK